MQRFEAVRVGVHAANPSFPFAHADAEQAFGACSLPERLVWQIQYAVIHDDVSQLLSGLVVQMRHVA